MRSMPSTSRVTCWLRTSATDRGRVMAGSGRHDPSRVNQPPGGSRGMPHVTRHKVGPRNPDTKLGRGSGRAYITGKPVICLPRWRSPMPRSLPVPVRQAIWRRFQDGQDGPTIAAALGFAPRTVRKLLRRFRCGGQAAVQPSYDRCGATTPKLPEPIVQAALGLRREHPTWGAGLIRVMLRRQRLHDPLPVERTLQRWFLRAGLAPAPAGRRPTADPRRAERPHEVWQMDAAERVPLQTGQRVGWLRIVDECSGAVLWTAVFPPGPLERGPAAAGPGAVAAGVHPLGAARAPAGGQRRAVGLGRRSAHRPGLVADRPGDRCGLEPAAAAAGRTTAWS